jgi:RNA recognition motif-containing protein
MSAFHAANHQMSTRLFVGNLSFNTTENQLNDAFGAHGQVVETNLMMDRMTGRSRGFAFITYGTPEEAQKAIAAMNGQPLDGRPLTVNIARPKEERAPGGPGGRDRGPRRDFGGGGSGGGGYSGGGSGGGGGGGGYSGGGSGGDRRQRY